MLSVTQYTYALFSFIFISFSLLIILKQRSDSESWLSELEPWEQKSFILAISLIIPVYLPPLTAIVTGEVVGYYGVYKSAPLMFQVLVPISALLILQNIYGKFIHSQLDRIDTTSSNLLGFGLACLSSVLIIVIPRYLAPINPELESAETGSFILYFGIVVWWVYNLVSDSKN